MNSASHLDKAPPIASLESPPLGFDSNCQVKDGSVRLMGWFRSTGATTQTWIFGWNSAEFGLKKGVVEEFGRGGRYNHRLYL
ncbi:unnamed protein product [Nippostrongylus brasiliensis]|uniref:Uncharacterized protein n=1 Tax=Nippostrongylus brasiliensis TaxID=27835 RepID=A0A0N4YFE9_NIPBR|nr:unnamed protein product [Nippostrongylus brasiliensis]